MSKNKYLLFLALIIVFLFLSGSTAHAMEVKLPGLGNNPTISDFVAYLFKFGISVGMFLALISFVVGAIGLINPNVEAHSDAKDRMKGAILGLGLMAGSFIILTTINTNFKKVDLNPLKGVNGVFLTDGKKFIQAPIREPDTSTLPSGFNTIKYVCKNGTPILVWQFPNKGLESGNGDLTNVTVVKLKCNESTSIGGSFKRADETPGIYYFLDAGCNKYASYANTASQNDIGAPFKGKMLGVKIVNDVKNGIFYGAIFHKAIGLTNGGGCSLPITDEGCKGVDEPSAVDIFKLNKEEGTGGNGVTFYSESKGWNTGQRSGYKNIPGGNIHSPFIKENAGAIFFDYTNVDRPPEYKSQNITFKVKPGSIRVVGGYLVALYSENLSSASEEDKTYCLTSTKNIESLGAKQFIASGSLNLEDIYIIPTQ